ncbi:MAG: hypothetical protein HYY91_01425 [Candidatus Omnitrophica bacterium]|nr:hypothetical protein [Candidatus Omnitrophota bacterium]
MTKLARQALLSLLASKPFQRRFARFIVHPVSLLAIATVFATIAGVWLTNYYQERAWVREKRFETFRQGYREALELVDELSELMSRRFFGLNRVVWVAKGTGTGELDQVWDEYYESVVEWNSKFLVYRSRLTRSIEPVAGVAFAASPETALDGEPGGVKSIHGYFFTTHQDVRKLVDCVRQRCSDEDKAAALSQAERSLEVLGVAIESFIETCLDRIHEHASQS